MKKFITIIPFLIIVLSSFSSKATTYASTANGDWTSAGTWSPGVPASGASSSNQNIIIIQAGHTVTIYGDVINLSNVVIYVYGTLKLDREYIPPITLRYPSLNVTGTGSGVIIQPGGDLESNVLLSNLVAINVNSTKVWDGINDIVNSVTQQKLPVGVNDPLPIVLVNWQVTVSGKNAVANWSTSSETNNKFFSIESSMNGVDFKTIATVSSKESNSTNLQTYSYNLNSLEAGLTYFRLKQTDLDGAYSYSSIVSVNITEENTISFYPNPVTGKRFSLQSSDKTLQYITINSAQSGRQVYHQEISGSINETITIELSESIEAGLYLLHIQHQDGVESKTLMIY